MIFFRKCKKSLTCQGQQNTSRYKLQVYAFIFFKLLIFQGITLDVPGGMYSVFPALDCRGYSKTINGQFVWFLVDIRGDRILHFFVLSALVTLKPWRIQYTAFLQSGISLTSVQRVNLGLHLFSPSVIRY